ncbi:DUF1524 domain-containing protein [Streptomyces sp. NBC_00233]|nr:DUF1524 domain-containing protein [Streptomyces sp. NBC_00233]
MPAEDSDAPDTAEDLHARLRHTPGNPTLTAVNSELHNHPFERKQGLRRHGGDGVPAPRRTRAFHRPHAACRAPPTPQRTGRGGHPGGKAGTASRPPPVAAGEGPLPQAARRNAGVVPGALGEPRRL